MTTPNLIETSIQEKDRIFAEDNYKGIEDDDEDEDDDNEEEECVEGKGEDAETDQVFRAASTSNDEDVFLDARDEFSPEEENEFDPEWRDEEKHFFVLSDSGKPIYCRHGDEDALASLTAVMQAHVSFVHDLGDAIRSITFEDRNITFLVKGPLILVGVTKGYDPQILVQLTYVYNQILSVLTLKQLTRIFDAKKGYDLRRMLGGSERLLDHLTTEMDVDPSFMLSSVKILPLPASQRDAISSAISQNTQKIENLVFAILMAENQLIALIRMKKYFIHPADLHLLFNVVNSSESFKHSEGWTPICLPKFNANGFLHAHVSYLKEDVPICLLMLTVESDIFFQLSEAKKRIVESLEKGTCITAIMQSLKTNSSFDSIQIGIPEIHHFLYKSKMSAQFISTRFREPYTNENDQKRLRHFYLLLQNRLYSTSRPLKLIFYSGASENILCWSTQAFDVYAAFDPLVSKISAINAVNKLLRWIKKEESSLFIHSAPTF